MSQPLGLTSDSFGVRSPSGVQAHRSAPDKIRESAEQFEALLIGSMLRQVREASSSTQEDQTSNTVREMAEQRMAEVMAASGGLGLAKLVVQGLNRETSAG